jgi:hypothetical protein
VYSIEIAGRPSMHLPGDGWLEKFRALARRKAKYIGKKVAFERGPELPTHVTMARPLNNMLITSYVGGRSLGITRLICLR